MDSIPRLEIFHRDASRLQWTLRLL